ncbi:MAG TPA: SDR family oxidoreductase [Xanthomonadaceae bacterium]|nr:SDR family oxidoreductase [Xanthomonadaceae bacterium]
MPDVQPFQAPTTNAASSQAGYALITGASSGIGAALAREYARRGKPLLLVARRADRLEAMMRELGAHVPCQAIVADLSVRAAPQAVFAEARARGLQVDTLVNNAGYGVPGRFLSSDWKTHADFLQVMVAAVAELTHLFLPDMEARGHGRILNVASTAALVPASAGHTLYGASKAFVIAFSESLALESKPRGVHVTALCPGMTYTEFHDVNGMRERVSRLPKSLWLDADTVARLGIDALERGDLRCVPGAMNRLIVGMSKYLPDRLARAIVNRRAADYRNAD